jgi:hypothetical protein
MVGVVVLTRCWLRPRRLESHRPGLYHVASVFYVFRMFHRHVSSVSCGCLQNYIGVLHMLQWLCMYVASVYSQCFICFFRHMLQMCLSGCCICFTHTLQVFYLDVAYVCNCFSSVFMCFMRMFWIFQPFHTCVAIVSVGCLKVDQGCFACCNVSQLPQLPAIATEASCMEGCSTAGVEGRGNVGSRWRTRGGWIVLSNINRVG